jgi:eukaryotic-like serine/threonine-protein kinase
MSETLPASDGVFNIPYSVSAGRVLTYEKLFPTKNAQFWSLLLPAASAGATSRTANGNGQLVLQATTADGAPELSPDAHWLAYASDESGDGRQVFVRAFPGPGGPWQVSTSGGNEPRWNPNGKEIFYRSGRRMMASEVETATGFRAGKPHALFEGDFSTTSLGYVRANYDVSPDGQRFLMIQPATASAPPNEITIVLNWSEELKRLVLVNK